MADYQKQQKLIALTVLTLIFLCSNILAQKQTEPQDLKNDSLFLWGEAVSNDRAEARQRAEVNLLSKIQVSINSSFMDMVSESQSGDSVSIKAKTRSQISNYTGMYLKGLKRIYIKKDNTWTVLVFIHKDSLRKSFKYRRDKITHYARNGIVAVKKGDLENGLKYLYWGYLLSRNYPDEMKIVCLTGGKSVRPRIAFQSKVSSILDNIKITARECYKDGSVIMAPLKFEYNGKPITKSYFNYYSGVGTDYAVIENGKIDIPIYDDPVSDSRKLTLNFEYEYFNEMSIDPEVKALHKFYKDVNFVNQKTVTIIFPWNKDTLSQKDDTLLVSSDSLQSNKSQGDTTQPDSANKIIDTANNRGSADSLKDASADSINNQPKPVSEKVAKKIESKTEAMQILIENKNDTHRFLQLLVQYKKLGKLSFGKRDDFAELSDIFVAIIDNKSVCNILLFTGKNYIDVESKIRYKDLKPKFKGKRLIWIKETQ